MKLSIIMPRRNRPFANECELRSLACQHFPKDEYELIVLDDSTTSETPAVFRAFSGELNIQFVHFDGWDRVPPETYYVGPNLRKSLSFHLNYGIRMALGEIVFLDIGEMVHLGETLYELTEPHDVYPALLFHAGAQDLTEDGLRTHSWHDHPHALLRRSEIWGQLACPPMTDDLEGMIGASVKAAWLSRVGGFDETFQQGIGAEDEELARRLRRAGVEIRSSHRIMLGHIAHPSQSGLADFVDESPNYRALRRNLVAKDAGYWAEQERVRYYRPGTEKAPIRANSDRAWGQVPSGLDVWTLDDTIERLGENCAG